MAGLRCTIVESRGRLAAPSALILALRALGDVDTTVSAYETAAPAGADAMLPVVDAASHGLAIASLRRWCQQDGGTAIAEIGRAHV